MTLLATTEAERRAFRFEAWRYDPVLMMRDAGLEPDPHQVELLRCMARNILVTWPRQSGKSQTLATVALHSIYFDPGDVIILAGEKQKQAREVFDKAGLLHAKLAEIGAVPAMEPVAEEMKFANGSRMFAEPSTVESIRGKAIRTAIVDEAAFTGDNTLAKVSPMLTTTNGRLICASTPNGATGWYYDAWHSPEPGWYRLTVSVEEMLAYPKPRLTVEELDRQRRILTPLQFRQEFGLEWLDGDQQFFPTETIEGALCDEIVPLRMRLAA